MLSVSQTIITNVEAGYIETYLRQKGLYRTEEDKGLELKYWLDKLLAEGKVPIGMFEEFLFEELFWGKRKMIRVYKLDNIKDYKYLFDWANALQKWYGIEEIFYNDILRNIPTDEMRRKIAAVHYEENSRGELQKIQILFALYIDVNVENGFSGSTAYIPVEIDFIKGIMIIKAWNRQQVVQEHNADNLMTHMKNIMQIEFGVKTQNYVFEHKKVLFSMSNKLINEVYSRVPTYNQIDNLQSMIGSFAEYVIRELPLQHVYMNDTDRVMIEMGVMDLNAEIRNVIENLAISDYFFDRDFQEMWGMGLEAVVAKIKFNDRERVLTSLSGENTEVPIICTKTFMALKKRMEETEKIESLWITMSREKGNLNLKFDAMHSEYLEILIRYGIRFNEKDMNSAIEIYEKYERELNQQTEKSYKIAIGQ